MRVTDDVFYVGVDDHDIDLFEGHYIVPDGMSYNSYLINDEKIVIMDSVGEDFTEEWISKISDIIGDRNPDYIIIQHMEPDHSGSLARFMEIYPDVTIVSSLKAFRMMQNFCGDQFEERRIVVKEGDELNIGQHNLKFIMAPMVHWPEVMMTYDSTDKILFSADAFGKFGASDSTDEWLDEARRYYIGIVGKYGMQVQNLLKKLSCLDIACICSLHGPVLHDDISYYLDKYDVWSSYGVEKDGILIAYTSVYGNTKKAVEILAEKLREKGQTVVVNDLARMDMAKAVENAFSYGKVVFATTTFNNEIFPYMNDYIHQLVSRNFQNRKVAFIENGSWAPVAEKNMRLMLESCKNLEYAENNISILSSLSEENINSIHSLADELCN